MRFLRSGLLAGGLVFALGIGLHERLLAQGTDSADIENLIANAHVPDGLDESAGQVFRDAVATYIYGYPLVAIATTEREATTTPDATAHFGRAPINQFFRGQNLPVGSSYKDVVLPSTTTMYASAFLNLAQEPLILHIPVVPDHRFYIFQLLDGWTNVNPASPGSRTMTQPGDYALVGTDRSYPLPAGLTGQINFDTNTAWIITRFYTTGTDSDQKAVADLFDEITLIPASAYGKGYTVPVGLPVNPSIDTLTQPIKQEDSMDACGFFSIMSSMLATNPPRNIDKLMMPRLERLGLIPTDKSQFSCSGLLATSQGRQTLGALELALLAAKEIMLHAPQPSPTPTNWSVPLNVGDYGPRYLLRALVAQKALGANRPQDAVYGYGAQDNYGVALNGANKYVLHFEAATQQHGALQIPPVNQYGFWSITLYQGDGTLNDNNTASWNALSTSEVQSHQIMS